MIEQIKYNRTTTALGRNGSFKSKGLEVMRCTEYDEAYPLAPIFVLTPLTRRLEPGRCEIRIPVESVNAVIALLQKAKNEISS